MSETLQAPFISREYPLKIALRFVSNDNVLVVRLKDEVRTKLSLLEIKAQILEEAKLVRHLQQQEQELEEFHCKLEAANQELQATRRELREANKELEITRRRLGEATNELEEIRRGLGEANNKIFSQTKELKKLSFLLEEKDHIEAMNFVEHDLSDVSLNTSIGSIMSITHSDSS